MTAHARFAVGISLIALAVELALAIAITPAWSPNGVNPVFLVFLAGPLAFLALLAWRRRANWTVSRFLLRIALVLAVPGVGVLVYDYTRFRSEQPGEHSPHMHPLILAIAQWIILLIVWILLVIREGRAERARQAAEKNS